MSRSSQTVLARRSRASLLNSGFLNCMSGARSEYFGIRRFRAAGTAAGDPAAAPVAAGMSVASGAGVVSGLLGWMVWVMAFLRGHAGRVLTARASPMWSNHTLDHVVQPHQVPWGHAYAPTCPAVDRGPAFRRPARRRGPAPGRADTGRTARRVPHIRPRGDPHPRGNGRGQGGGGVRP